MKSAFIVTHSASTLNMYVMLFLSEINAMKNIMRIWEIMPYKLFKSDSQRVAFLLCVAHLKRLVSCLINTACSI
ncbi:protein of unknown function (plasmid) [Vibrio harveyi]|nr:protein of unknown function [Vibrio harveyi]